jgi:hypothetical protein
MECVLLDPEQSMRGEQYMKPHPGYWLGSLLCGALTLPASALAGQSPAQVPIHGVTGTIATPESVERFYDGVNKTLVKTGEGIDRLRGATKAKPDGEAASLDGLRPGTSVVVHYSVKGIQTSADANDAVERSGSSVNEGIVTNVDRSSKRITIRFAGGSTETLRLTRSTSGGRVIVYYPDRAGQQAAHYFKPAS